MKQSISKQVAKVLDANPYYKQAIKMGIANYSAIAKQLGVKGSDPALKAAVMRYAETMEQYDYVPALKKLMKNTTVQLKSNIAVVVMFPSLDSLLKVRKLSALGRDFSIVSSPNSITLVFDEHLMDKVLKTVEKKNIVKKTIGLCQIILTTLPKLAEETPGWVAFHTELLARNGINVLEYYSCYTDMVFVLKKSDAVKAYNLISSI